MKIQLYFGSENVQKLFIVMVSQLCDTLKITDLYVWVNCIVCELYLNTSSMKMIDDGWMNE